MNGLDACASVDGLVSDVASAQLKARRTTCVNLALSMSDLALPSSTAYEAPDTTRKGSCRGSRTRTGHVVLPRSTRILSTDARKRRASSYAVIGVTRTPLAEKSRTPHDTT